MAEGGDKTRGLTYRDAGVDIDAGNALVDAIMPLAAMTSRPGTMASLGGFGGLFDLKATGYVDPILVAANDGVGTKVKIAIETGLHKTIGIDLVAMCVNDLVVQGAEPLFFLDYFATGKLDTGIAADVISGIVEGCRQAGCALIGGETAEMPGMYAEGDYDLAGFSVGAVERSHVLPRGDMTAGDVLIGLPSSGPHSNGYSLIRRIVADSGSAWDDTFPGETDNAGTVGSALITPTKIYVLPILRAIMATGAIKALAHITGGGLTENLPRVLPKAVSAEIDLAALTQAWTLEPRARSIFHWLSSQADIAETEMLRTLNCGVGMVLVADAQAADAVLESLEAEGEPGFVLGRLAERSGGDAVIYHGSLEF